MGRPSLYTPELMQEIYRRLSDGEPLRQICRGEGMPDPSTIWDWAKKDADISQAIARARELGEDAIADECMEIADDATNDWMLQRNGPALINKDNVLRSKLRIETRLKLLAKWNPKKYGDRTALEHTGPGGTELVVTLRSVLDDPK